MSRARLFQLVSLLLTFPDREFLGARAQIVEAATEFPDLTPFTGWLTTTDDLAIQQHFVDMFDLRRKSGLNLTYYLHGDTRKRGVALLTLKQRYRAHGLTLADGELPDLLPVVLEFAALVGPGDGEAPLRQHRQGVELLRESLHDAHSPYAAILDVICAVLPEMSEADIAAVKQLAAEGPPSEAVGLAPYPVMEFSS